MINIVDAVTDSITMYRLVLYYLIGLLVAAMGLSLIGDVNYGPLAIAGSAAILVSACWIINRVLAYIFEAPLNSESSLITGLILALIISPDLSKFGVLFLLAASGLAMASKYILAINRKHIFNPAAIAVLLTALGPLQAASWWVGSAAMLPFVVIGGMLVVYKVRRKAMVASFLVATTVVTAGMALAGGGNPGTSLHNMIFSSAIFFLAAVMLTEPLTSPSTANKQIWYGVLVGTLVSPQVHVLGLYTSPELALVIGNAFAYIASPRVKLFLTLKDKVKVAANTVDFVFAPAWHLAYEPGQYMEFTLRHSHTDSRGSRRYFTLASSPTERDVRIGVKFYDQGSSYKTALLKLDAAVPVVAAQIAGDFTLPKNPSKKLAFIAGGIGITPFRSMVKYLLDTNAQRDIVLLYGACMQRDIAYAPVFEAARKRLGIRASYILSDERLPQTPNVYSGTQITEDIIRREIPDFHERTFYVSGTHQMVSAMAATLKHMGVPGRHIKKDFFPGYA